MPTHDSATTIKSRVIAIVRRPSAGPFFFGLLLGGIPFAIVLHHLGLESNGWEPRFLYFILPLAGSLAGLSAVLGGAITPRRLLWRALLTSFAACVPLPLLTWIGLAEPSFGSAIFDFRNFPYWLVVLMFWTLAAGFLGWIAALGLHCLKSKDV